MKKIIQSLLLLCVLRAAKAQTFSPPVFADVDNNYRTYVNRVFGALETNRVTIASQKEVSTSITSCSELLLTNLLINSCSKIISIKLIAANVQYNYSTT